MSEKTNIAWADSSGSPWFGCTEVSPGCSRCYARELTLKYKWAGWGDKSPRVRSKGFEKNVRAMHRKPWVCNKCAAAFENIHAILESKDDCFHLGGFHRRRIFPSLMDWLDPQVPIAWLADFLKLIHETPNLDWLLLTKRPELFAGRLRETSPGPSPAYLGWLMDWLNGYPPANVWIGVTVEDQKRADERIPTLLKIPSKVHWLSVEPLLEPINFLHCFGDACSPDGLSCLRRDDGIDWAVVGGESGGKRRDCGVKAIIDVAVQCQLAEVPVWVKQDCAHRPGTQGRIPNDIWNLKQIPH